MLYYNMLNIKQDIGKYVVVKLITYWPVICYEANVIHYNVN